MSRSLVSLMPSGVSHVRMSHFSVVAVSLTALLVAGCTTTRSPETTGSISRLKPASRSDGEWREIAASAGKRYEADPSDAQAAITYGQALRATGQTAQAVAVLENATIRHANNRVILAAYGRALADVGRFEQALDVLGRAHSPDNPDWTILNAQGAILDQMGRSDEAMRYYQTALRMAPEEPAILSNIGLSFMLKKDLDRAEMALQRAARHPDAGARVRQNLALVLVLRGRQAEAEEILARDVSAEDARKLVAGWTKRKSAAQG